MNLTISVLTPYWITLEFEILLKPLGSSEGIKLADIEIESTSVEVFKDPDWNIGFVSPFFDCFNTTPIFHIVVHEAGRWVVCCRFLVHAGIGLVLMCFDADRT
jgi:hypothetical protein